MSCEIVHVVGRCWLFCCWLRRLSVAVRKRRPVRHLRRERRKVRKLSLAPRAFRFRKKSLRRASASSRLDDLEQKQTERVADALRQVPGLSVVQTGPPGQLTSVFTRGLRSEHTQVLLDGIPINQGLAGLFNFADLTTDDIDRIEVVRGPQSTRTAHARSRE